MYTRWLLGYFLILWAYTWILGMMKIVFCWLSIGVILNQVAYMWVSWDLDLHTFHLEKLFWGMVGLYRPNRIGTWNAHIETLWCHILCTWISLGRKRSTWSMTWMRGEIERDTFDTFWWLFINIWWLGVLPRGSHLGPLYILWRTHGMIGGPLGPIGKAILNINGCLRTTSWWLVDPWSVFGHDVSFEGEFGGHFYLHRTQHLNIGPILLLMSIRNPSPRGFLMVYMVHLGVFSIILFVTWRISCSLLDLGFLGIICHYFNVSGSRTLHINRSSPPHSFLMLWMRENPP